MRPDRANSRAPGLAFEANIANLLRGAGLRVASNAGAARPRQTDLYARATGVELLVEVKDRKKKVDVADIDNLRARLWRTPSDVVGAIFTKSPVTRSAVKELETDRRREIVVFLQKEIEAIRHGRALLLNLLARKREELRVHGRAWFWNSKRAADIELPRPTVDCSQDGKSRAYFHSRTGFAHAAYTLNLPDTGWSESNGEGALLPLRLTLNTIDDMQEVLEYVHDRFGLSAEGSFAIHQSGACWHGMGVQNFLKAAAIWRQRYAEARLKRAHHSEDLVYFDQFRDGWLLLSTRQRVYAGEEGGPDSFLHTSDLGIQLPGIPLDVGPFVELCRHTGNEWGQFKFINHRLTQTLRLKQPIKLKVVGTVLKSYDNWTRGRWVVGLIAHNPFFRKKSLPRELAIDDFPARDLLQIELLLCDLQDHLEEGTVVDSYTLKGFETTVAHHKQIIRPFGTWNKILRRAKRESEIPADAERDLEEVLLDMPDDFFNE